MRVSEDEEKKSAAIKRVKKKCKLIRSEVDNLSEVVNKVPYDSWKNEPDLSVSEAMNEIDDWQKHLEKIERFKEELDDLVFKNGLNEDDEIQNVAILVDRLSDDVKHSIRNIKAEDKYRELYSLATAPTEKVKFPTFEGRDDEDFAKFKLEVERAFVKNRITKSDKLDKLRDVLKGHAKMLISQPRICDIDEAWEVLSKSFGNPLRLMNYWKKALLELGFLLKSNVRGGLKAQVKWYLEVESLVQNIINLGKKSRKLEREAFSYSTIKSIKKLFPLKFGDKLNKCTGDGIDEMEAILKKITDFRLRTQENQLVYDDAPQYSDTNGWFGNYETTNKTKAKLGVGSAVSQTKSNCKMSPAAAKLRQLRKKIYQNAHEGIGVEDDLKRYRFEVETFVNLFKENISDRVISIWRRKVDKTESDIKKTTAEIKNSESTIIALTKRIAKLEKIISEDKHKSKNSHDTAESDKSQIPLSRSPFYSSAEAEASLLTSTKTKEAVKEYEPKCLNIPSVADVDKDPDE